MSNWVTVDYEKNFYNYFRRQIDGMPVFDDDVIDYGWRLVNGLGLYGVMSESEILYFAFEKMNVRQMYKAKGWEWNLDKY